VIQFELMPDKGILMVTPTGPLERADFEKLAQAVDPFIEAQGKLNGLMICVESFPGWKDFGALLSHLKFVKDHHRHILRVAAVTDSGFLSILPLVAKHFVRAEVRHFDYQDKDKALAWLDGPTFRILLLADAEAVAREAAAFIAREAKAAVAARGRFILAVSGGHTPWQMLRVLGEQELPWEKVQVVQVDERVAPEGDPDRNLTHLRESLLAEAPLKPAQIHAMPVEVRDLTAAVAHYAQTLRELAGSPPVLDLVHLGLGPDGHIASLVPHDAVLDITDADVALTRVYQGRHRMTLTYPILNRARRILWLVTGAEKADMLVRLHDGDPSIPAGRVHRDQALVFADRAAAAKLGAPPKSGVPKIPL
jgi:6-phosphogluconolactonase